VAAMWMQGKKADADAAPAPPRPPSRLSRLYTRTVRSPGFNNAVLGLLGAWAFVSGSSEYLKRDEPWPGGVTLGVMAMIYAAQKLTNAPRAELISSWRIFTIFFGLYMCMKMLADPVPEGGGIGWTVGKYVLVLGVVVLYSKFWRGPSGTDEPVPGERPRADA
jgi:hypothetical protein